VTPLRITDTRTGSGFPNAGSTLTATAPTLTVQVTGLGGVPAGASAAVLNVTATNTKSSGFFTVFPAGSTQPTVSNLNFVAGQTVANLVTVALSAAGAVSIYSSGTDADAVVDVEGYYTSTPSTNGYGLYDAVAPFRAIGTLADGAPVAAGTSVPVTVAGGTTSVPASAIAVVLNVTVAHDSAASVVSVYPAPAITTKPAFSNVNSAAGEAVANRVIVPVGTGGQVEVYNLYGSADVDVDVTGYYTGVGGIGSDFTPLAAPVRVADTRTASLVGTETAIGAAKSESFSLATAASGIPATATAVAANVTVVSGATSGYLSIYPAPAATTQPGFSDMNWVANDIVQNFSIAPTNGTGSVEIYNSYGTVDVVADVFGYFTAVVAGPLMVSAVATDASIVITYNEGVTCPSGLDNINLAFVYDWTGSASGGAFAAACSGGGTSSTPDVLTLTPESDLGFTVPGSGATLTYTAAASRTTPETDSTAYSVYATGNTSSFEQTQTLALTAAAGPTMVSAVYNNAGVGHPQVVVTYNEDVICPTADAATLFTYTWTGEATDGVTACLPGALGTDTLILTVGADQPVLPASVTYTVPSAGNALGTAVYATGTAYSYAATQTISVWGTPTITAATVVAGSATTTPAASITVTYNETGGVVCPTTPGSVQADFEYTNAGSPAYPTTCVAGGVAGTIVLGGFMTTATGATAATLVLPGASDTLDYTVPATNSAVYAPTSVNYYPQFPAAQQFALAATAVPAISAAVWENVSTLEVTYGGENVACPATGADGDFVYDSGFEQVGGTVTGCTAATDVLTLTGVFNAPGAASLIYTAPAVSTTSNAVSAAGSASAFAATQTFFPVTG